MSPSCWTSALLSVAPTIAFTTLLTQCTPYLPLVPTVMPTTFTNPSPPPSTRYPNLPPYFHTRIAQGLSSAPHPPQVPSRAFWRCNVYGTSEARTSTLSPRAPARLPGAGFHVPSRASGGTMPTVSANPCFDTVPLDTCTRAGSQIS